MAAISREVYRLRVLWKVFGPSRQLITGGYRQLHTDELYGLCFSPNTIRGVQIVYDEMGEECGTCWREQKCTQNFAAKS